MEINGIKLKDMIRDSLDTLKENGILNVTKEMQSEEKVHTVKVRKDRSTHGCFTQTITFNGKHTFTTDNCIQINIEGDVHTVDTQGSVTCKDVTGNISTQGRVTCENVGKGISTQGRVTCGDVGGSINTMGRVEANNVKGSIDTMGKVSINSKG